MTSKHKQSKTGARPAAVALGPAAPRGAALTPKQAVPYSLEQLVRALSPSEQQRMIERVGVRIDPAMRIDAALQLCRAIVSSPEARDIELLEPDVRQTLRAVAGEGGTLLVSEVTPSAQELVSRGMLFVADAGQHKRLIVPLGLLMQLRPLEGEDSCSARVLLWHTSDEVKAAIASYYLGRPATRPLCLSLEAALHALNSPAHVVAQLDQLSPAERRLLGEVEERGGEVDTAELLDLEREPFRLHNAGGQSLARRGIGYSLERRGLLIPLHPNRHIMPRSVAAEVGAGRQLERAAERSAILHFVLEEDHAPRRARFAKNPGPLAFALALLRASEFELKDSTATRSPLARWASRLGQDVERVTLIAALSRVAGLWDCNSGAGNLGAGNSDSMARGTAPLRDCSSEEAMRLLFNAWYKSGIWNEAHPGNDMGRAGKAEHDSGVLYSLRTLVLQALLELGHGRWVPWEALAGYLRTDARAAGLTRLINRWAARANIEPQPIAEIARRMTLDSLHALGIVDLAVAELDAGDLGSEDEEPEAELGTTLRVTPRGLNLLSMVLAKPRQVAHEPGVGPREPSTMLDCNTLRVGDEVRLSQLLALSPFVEVQAIASGLELKITPGTVGQALAQGMDAARVAQLLAAVVAVPEETRLMLDRAGAVRGSIEHVACAGFLRTVDPQLRELLLTKRQTMDLFLPSSPPDGLLIAPAADFEQLVRRCRIVGIEVTSGGQVCRTSSTRPPPARSEAAPALRHRRPVLGRDQGSRGR